MCGLQLTAQNHIVRPNVTAIHCKHYKHPVSGQASAHIYRSKKTTEKPTKENLHFSFVHTSA